jgi:hypothetical protein
MFRRREFLDFNNPEDYRFAIKLLHDSYVGPGNPKIELLYHKEFSGLEACKRAWVIDMADMQVKDFMEKAEAQPDDVKSFIIRYPDIFPFSELRAERKSE